MMSDAGIWPAKIGISFVYLSAVYELTVNTSPDIPLWNLSNIINNFLDGAPAFAFLIILE